MGTLSHTTGSVFIGKLPDTTPSYTLDVRGGNDTVRLHNPTAKSVYLSFKNTAAVNVVVGVTGANHDQFSVSTNVDQPHTVNVLSSGVAIGKPTPSSGCVLDVEGKVRCSVGTTSGSVAETLTTKGYVDSVLIPNSVGVTTGCLDLPVDYTDSATTSFPIGQFLCAYATTLPALNATVTVRLGAFNGYSGTWDPANATLSFIGNMDYYSLVGTGTVLSGTWKYRGLIGQNSNNASRHYVLCQRVS
jgi:hypothetical protein